jgi:gamma-glutamyl-gamma-aminobutyrate hydrolase PuuD
MRALISQRESVDQYSVGIDVLESTYVMFFERIGINLRPVSNFHADIESIFDDGPYDLVILTGGGTIESKYYDKAHSDELQINRDCVEKKIVSEAIHRKIPILAICRGMQLINGLCGGYTSKLKSLCVPRKIRVDHPVLLGDERVYVNNYHNSGILKRHLGSKLTLVALDEENDVVEGFYHAANKILGVQWHPERKFNTSESYLKSENLITSFNENRGTLDERYYISRGSGNST